jgi:hypothetical protein
LVRENMETIAPTSTHSLIRNEPIGENSLQVLQYPGPRSGED